MSQSTAEALAVLQWVTGTLFSRCDILVETPQQNIWEIGFDSLSMVTMMTAIEEKWTIDFGDEPIDRTRWASAVHISQDIIDVQKGRENATPST